MTIDKQVSLHGKRAFITNDDRLAGRNGFVAGGDDKPAIVYPSPDTVAVFEDFTGPGNQAADTGVPLHQGFVRRVAGDTGHHATTIAGASGVFQLFTTPSAGAAKVATSGQGISGALQFKGNSGVGAKDGFLHVGARVKSSSVSRTIKRLHAFVGFTDIATFEFPAFDTGAGVISAASDYMGLMLSPGGDTGWSGVAGKSTAGDSGDQVVALDNSVVDNTYDVVEAVYRRGISDTGGTVNFYVNGVHKGSINSPVSPTVALAPCIYAFQQDTGGEQLDIDYFTYASNRDTGL